jgi:4-hydroxybenzoyl-CoA thioesterase
MTFHCQIPVRFGDVDYAKIVYYPRHLHFCHVAMEELFAAVVGVPYHESVATEKIGYPTIRVEAEYFHPVGFGETIDMGVSIERLGTKSVHFRYEGTRKSDGVLAFVVRNVQVAVHMDDWQSVPIPPHHREGFGKVLRAPPLAREG